MGLPQKILFGTLLWGGVWLGSASRAQGQAAPATVLRRPVQLPATARQLPLAAALAELSRQTGVPISYSGSRIGAGRPCRLPGGPAQPLGTVLHSLLTQRRLSYGLLGGQVVLWPAQSAPPAGVTAVNGRGVVASGGPAVAAGRPGAAAGAGEGSLLLSEKAAAARTPTALDKATSTADRAASVRANGGREATEHAAAGGANFASAAAAQRLQRKATKQAASAPNPKSSTKKRSAGLVATRLPLPSAPVWMGTAAAAGARSRRAHPEDAANRNAQRPRRETAAADSLAPQTPREVKPVVARAGVPTALAAVPLAPEVGWPALRRRPGQVSLLPPLSTNGWANARANNLLSLNAVAGYAGGLRAVELGGVANLVRDTVRGFQAAGVLNLTGTEVRGVQLAGLANVSGGSVRGLQAAGLLNVNRDDARGVQLAGLLNLTGGAGRAHRAPAQATRVRRWLGVPRLMATNPGAALPALAFPSQPGFLLQVAAAANLTGTDVRGLQTAALLNTARQVRGVQFGLVNVAKHVRGVQFGLINIADSLEGVPLGLLNVVHHNGYLRGEVWASETLPLNAVIKLGVRRYYTIIGASAQPFGNRLQWAGGFGVGTAGRPHGRLTLSCDLMSWTFLGAAGVASLNQFRPAVAWQIEREGHLQLVLASTLNVSYESVEGGGPSLSIGSNQWLWVEELQENSQTRLWPGFQVGLRF